MCICALPLCPCKTQSPLSFSVVVQLWVSLYHEPCPICLLGSSSNQGASPGPTNLHGDVLQPFSLPWCSGGTGLSQTRFPLHGQRWSHFHTRGPVCLTGAMQNEWRGLGAFSLPLGETALMGARKETLKPLCSSVWQLLWGWRPLNIFREIALERITNWSCLKASLSLLMVNGMKRVQWEEIKYVQVPPSLQLPTHVGKPGQWRSSGLIGPGAAHLPL